MRVLTGIQASAFIANAMTSVPNLAK